MRRSAQAEDRPALFAAQFALSHACWLLTYPLAGWLGAFAGIPITLGVLGLVTLLGFVLAVPLACAQIRRRSSMPIRTCRRIIHTCGSITATSCPRVHDR